MTFTVLPDMVAFGAIFEEVALARPYSGPPQCAMPVPADGAMHFIPAGGPFEEYVLADDRWKRGIRNFILDVLEAACAPITLVTDDPDLPPRSVESRTLRHVAPSRLRYSVFDTLDWSLRALEKYDRAKIFITQDAANAVRKALKQPRQKGGAPEHPAKAWYAHQGFERRGRTMKALQREMREALDSAPSERAIRCWEKAGREDRQ